MGFDSWDLQGLAIIDYYTGNLDAELIVESDCAGTEKMPASIFFRTLEQLPDLERYALGLCNGTILDIGAGAGSHSLILQQQGFEVSAVDISPFSVAVMQQRGLERAICSDIWDFKAEPFDTILMLMNGIGLAGDLKGLELFLKDIKRLLKPEGQILLDSTDLGYLRQEPGIKIRPILKKGANYGKVRYQMEYRGIKGPSFNWLFVDQDTLRKYSRRTGWGFQVIYEEDSQYLARLVPA
jgi:SAM-dependent methyltransferase